MEDKKILHYTIKYQDSNIAIIRFSKEEIDGLQENSEVWIESSNDIDAYWKCFRDSLMETFGVLFVMIEGYEIIIIKDTNLPNWARIIKDVIWCSIMFLCPNYTGAMQVSKNGNNIGKLITMQILDEIKPEPRQK